MVEDDLNRLKAFLGDDAVPQWMRDAVTAEINWLQQARPKQVEPEDDFEIWIALAGRGFGKTRLGAEWVRKQATLFGPRRIAVVGRTEADVRDTVFEGESGICNVIPESCVQGGYAKGYRGTLHDLRLVNGSIIKGYSSESPHRLRGPQFHKALCDELAAWENMLETWEQLQMTLRLGDRVQTCITTTPKGLPLIIELANYALKPLQRPKGRSPLWKIPKTILTRGSSRENLDNLADNVANNFMKYDGTDRGREEIDAEILDLTSVAPIKRHWIRFWTPVLLPRPDRVIISVDPAGKDTYAADPTAIQEWGLFHVPCTITYESVEDPSKGIPVSGTMAVLVLLGAEQARMAYPVLKERLKARYDHYRKAMKGRDSDQDVIMLIEDTSSGIQMNQEFLLAGLPAVPWKIPGNASKRERADVVSDLVKDGLVYFVGAYDDRRGMRSTQDWVPFAEDVAAEVCAYTGEGEGEPDHHVDAFTQCLAFCRKQGWLEMRGDANPRGVKARDEEEVDREVTRSTVKNAYAEV